jgi:hypothetical protein
MPCQNPFRLPDHLDLNLRGIISLWRGLKRAENSMPFADDLELSALSDLPVKPFLLSAFATPERFRFEFLSEGLRAAAVTGSFIDETSPDNHFCYLRAQASATIEAAEPTFLRLADVSGQAFSRVLLPMWGNGEINALLGAIDG